MFKIQIGLFTSPFSSNSIKPDAIYLPGNASNVQKFLILEMASQVITKVKIGSIEQESLMLAGRLLILENKEAIVKLLD